MENPLVTFSTSCAVDGSVLADGNGGFTLTLSVKSTKPATPSENSVVNTDKKSSTVEANASSSDGPIPAPQADVPVAAAAPHAAAPQADVPVAAAPHADVPIQDPLQVVLDELAILRRAYAVLQNRL